MKTDAVQGKVPPPVTPRDMEMARLAQQCIVEALDRSKAVSISLVSDDEGQPPVEVPPPALRLIAQLFAGLSEGKAVTVMPMDQELTTVEAANFLNVSRPFVIKEIEAGRLPFRMVGTHRRIEFSSLIEYRKRMREQQEQALQDLAELNHELGLSD